MKFHSEIVLVIQRLAFLVLIAISHDLAAEPYLALKTGAKCSQCHVNPIGGGSRNDFGTYYGNQVLPAVINSALGDPGRISDQFRLGGDLRFNFDYTDSEAEDSRTFETQSAQLYFSMQPKSTPLLFYIDQQVAPGSSLSREAFALARIFDRHYIKAGKIMLPFGLRLEDDTALVRQATQINFDNSDNGVEAGFEFDHAVVNFAISNGTSSTGNDDEEFQYLLRAEAVYKTWRLGSSVLVNESPLGDRTLLGVFGGIQWRAIGLMFELDEIEDESILNPDDEPQTQRVGLLEINAEVRKGFNVKATAEYWDPDIDIAENHRTRNSLLLEYTPISHVQWRSGIRDGEDIPQRGQGNFTQFFTQLHMYF